MTNIEYFKTVLQSNFLHKLDWYYSTMGLNPVNSEFLKVENNSYIVKLPNGEETMIENVKSDRPLLLPKEEITLSNSDLPNIVGELKTTVGRAIANKILLVYPFHDKFPYVNGVMNPGDIEDELAKRLNNESVSVREYNKFVNCCVFIQSLSKVVTIGATEKSISGAPGIEKFKKDLSKKYDNEYGKKWRKDTVKVGSFIEEIKKYDQEYLKDDPTLGKTLTKKIQNNARVKQYVAFGTVEDFGDTNEFVEESLAEGYPKDKVKLATIFNSSRQGSHSRGHETQKGGAVAKSLLRVASGIFIKEGDCGSQIYKEIFVTKDLIKALTGVYYLNGTKLEKLLDPTPLVGQTIKIRSPLYCLKEGKIFCTTCCGENLRNRENGIGLQLTNISAGILTAALKSMHDTSIKLVNVDINEIIK